MVKAKGKAVGSPKKKSEKPKKVAEKASKMSQEFVVDSDNEDAAPEEQKVKKVTVPKTESKSSKKQKPAPVPAKKPSSDEDEEDGEDDSSDEKEVQGPPPRIADQVPAKVNGVKRSSEEQSSDESSEESTSEEEAEAGRAIKKAKVDQQETPESSEESEDDGEEEESDNEEKDDERASKERTKQSKAAAQQREPEPAPALPAKPYVPPSGYTPLEISDAAVLPASSLSGKQIWHITAPSGVPLSSIAEVSMEALRSGKPVLSHKGADYTLNEEHVGDANRYIYLPGRDGYVAAPQRVSRTLHLQQTISLPNLTRRQANPTEGSAAAADVAEAAVSTVRPQPKGLRMRWKPLGFGAGEPGMPASSSDEEDRARSKHKDSFQFPKALGAHEGSELLPNKNGEVPAKKQKKKRKEKESKDLIADSDLAEGAGAGKGSLRAEVSHQQGSQATLAVSPAKKAVMPEAVADANGDVAMADGEEGQNLSKEVKAKRKEEKRKKKEAKAKARAAA